MNLLRALPLALAFLAPFEGPVGPPAPPPAPAPAKPAAPEEKTVPLSPEQFEVHLLRAEGNLRLHGLSLQKAPLKLALADFRAAVKGLPEKVDGDRRFRALFGLGFALARTEFPETREERDALVRECYGLLDRASVIASDPPGRFSIHPGLWIVGGIIREQSGDPVGARDLVLDGFRRLETLAVQPEWMEDQLRLFGLLARGRAYLQEPLNSDHLALPDFKAARELAEKSLKDPLTPRDTRLRPVVLTHLAAAYQSLDYFDDAEKLLTELVSTDPGSAAHPFHMALVKANQMKYSDALSWYRRAAELDPADPRPHVKIAFILLRYPEPGKEPDLDAARREGEKFQQLLGGEPGAEYCSLRGEISFLRRDAKDAESWYRKALSLDPDCRTALQNLIILLGQKEDPGEAVRAEIERIRKKLQDSKGKEGGEPGQEPRRRRTDLTFC